MILFTRTGFEYGGFDPMGGFGNNYNMDMGGGGFMGGGEMEVKSSEKKVSFEI